MYTLDAKFPTMPSPPKNRIPSFMGLQAKCVDLVPKQSFLEEFLVAGFNPSQQYASQIEFIFPLLISNTRPVLGISWLHSPMFDPFGKQGGG
jgi:hypothetical protein